MPPKISMPFSSARYATVHGARNTGFFTSMRQLPKRLLATAQKPCSNRLLSCVTKSSFNSSQKLSSEGFSFLRPRSATGGTRMRCSAAWYCVGGATPGTGTPLLAALTGRGPLELDGAGLEGAGLHGAELEDREIALSFPIYYPWRKLKRTKSESKCGG